MIVATHTRCEFTESHEDMGAFYGYGDGWVTWRCSNSTRVIVVLKHEPWATGGPKLGRTVWRLCREHADLMVTELASGVEPGTHVHKTMAVA